MTFNIKILFFLLFFILSINTRRHAAGVENEIVLDYKSSGNKVLLEDAIKRRRSVREYSSKGMTFKDISKLLYFANGVTKEDSFFGNFRAAPSAGATYPIEIYLVSNGIKNLADGLYWYNVENDSIVLKKEGSFNSQVAESCYGQNFISHAESIFIMTAVWERTLKRYHERGRRYVFMDAGHIAQNIYLEATALGLAPCAVGAFDDGKMNTFLSIDGKKESCVYIMVVGK